MKTTILTGAAAALVLAIGFGGEARAQCYWSAVGYQCPTVGYSQPSFGVYPELGWYGAGGPYGLPPSPQRYRNLRPDSGYPGPALTGSKN